MRMHTWQCVLFVIIVCMSVWVCNSVNERMCVQYVATAYTDVMC